MVEGESICSPSIFLLIPKTTPYMVIVNAKGQLVYTGAIDDKPSANPKTLSGAVNYVSEDLKALLAGKELPYGSTKSYGCSVKY